MTLKIFTSSYLKDNNEIDNNFLKGLGLKCNYVLTE